MLLENLKNYPAETSPRGLNGKTHTKPATWTLARHKIIFQHMGWVKESQKQVSNLQSKMNNEPVFTRPYFTFPFVWTWFRTTKTSSQVQAFNLKPSQITEAKPRPMEKRPNKSPQTAHTPGKQANEANEANARKSWRPRKHLACRISKSR